MAHRKAGGTAKNLRDSNPQYLGIKLFGGQIAHPGAIIVRQRGSRVLAGTNTRMGKDQTIYSVSTGTVEYSEKRIVNYDGFQMKKKVANVIERAADKK